MRTFLIITALIMCSVAALADTMTFYPTEDVRIFRDSPTTYDNNGYLGCPCNFDATNFQRSLLRFDVSGLPANVDINSAKVVLTYAKGVDTGIGTNVVYDLWVNYRYWTNTASWTRIDSANDIKWNLYSSGSWNGKPAGSASGQDWWWIAASATVTYDANTPEYTQLEFTGAGLADVVNQWYKKLLMQTGFIISGNPYIGNKIHFYQKETAPEAQYQPKLIVEYTPRTDTQVIIYPDQCVRIGNNWGDTSVAVGFNFDGANYQNTPMHFDLSSIPANAVINSARVQVTYNNTYGGSSSPLNQIFVYKLTEPFTEAANWLLRDGVNNWATAGGSYAVPEAAMIQLAINKPATPQASQYAWNITSLVSAWHSGVEPNNGVIIKASPKWAGGATGGTNNLHAFHKGDPTESYRPQLIVNYSIPVQTYTLTINSVNPDNGVTIDINDGADAVVTSGAQKTYNAGTDVKLTAPATAPNGNTFVKWLKDGNDFSTDMAIVVTVTADADYTAVYETPAPTDITVSGVVGLNDIVGQNPNYAYKATFKIYKSGNTDCGSPDVVKTADLDANGNYSFTVAPQGADCTVVVKAGTQTALDPSARYHFLAKKLTGIDLNANTVLTTVNLVNGDINDDNLIDAFDFTIMMQAYDINEDTASGESDLNNDGYVDAFDFTILMLSYDSAGDFCN